MEDKRETKFELLRIISIIGIVIFHFSDWGGLMFITENIPNKLFGYFINIFGKLGSNIFILISGYFLINSKFKTKKLLKIIGEVWFYSVAIALICTIFNIGDVNKNNIIKSFMPLTFNLYWFATSYVGLYLIFPIINKVLNNITNKEHLIIVILFGILASLIPTFFIEMSMFENDLLWFIYLYIVASYIRKYDIKFMKNNVKNFFIIIGIITFLFMMSVLFVNIDYELYDFNKMNSIFILLLSVYILMFFKNLKMEKENKIVKLLARSSFAVYLIHINFIFRNYLFFNILRIKDFYNANLYILIGYVILSSILIYIICVLIDLIRIKLIENQIFKIKKFDKFFEKIDKAMQF